MLLRLLQLTIEARVKLTQSLILLMRKLKDRKNFKNRVGRVLDCKIVVGAGGIYDGDWIPSDQNVLDLLNLKHWQRFFSENEISAILAEHVWEHLDNKSATDAARNCHAYLKPGGYLRVAVPDGFHPDPVYIDAVKPGGNGAGADDHKILYNYRSLSHIFESVGFTVKLLEYFDEKGVFHFVDWDPAAGKIYRSRRFDQRNCNGKLNYTSVVLDAYKKCEQC